MLRGISKDQPHRQQRRPSISTCSPGILPVLPASAASVENSKSQTDRPYFCIWPACNKAFRFRSEWARHEEAVHCQPYHWICCLEEADAHEVKTLCFVCGETGVTLDHYSVSHFIDGAGEEREPWTFYREDQLAQHIKGVHLANVCNENVPSKLVSSWRMPNPSIDRSASICGFCGVLSETSGNRQSHVAHHFKDGALNSAWVHAGISRVCHTQCDFLSYESGTGRCIGCEPVDGLDLSLAQCTLCSNIFTAGLVTVQHAHRPAT
jgi:hypothetical protein